MAVVTSTVIAAISVAAAAASAYAGVAQAQASKDAGKAQNKAAEAEAKNAELENAEQMKRERDKSKRALSTIRARLAGTGTVTDAGTPLAILGENAGNIELSFQDAARRNAMQIASVRQQGAMAKYAGNQAYKGGMIEAAGNALGSVGALGAQYDKAVYTGQVKDTFGIYKTKSKPLS